jgi:Putative metallopeptidase
VAKVNPCKWTRFVASVAAALLATPVSAHQPASSLDQERVDFVMGNFQFTLLHELAHVAISDLNVPILGPEEPAADYIAAMFLLRPLKEPPLGAEQWLQFAMNATDAFGILWDEAETADASAPYWDTHGLSIQRAYDIACLIYGSNPKRFESVLEFTQLPKQRSQGCQAEYQRAAKAVDWLVTLAQTSHRGSTEARMSVRYEPPRTKVSESLVNEIRSRRLVEWTVERFGELVTLDDNAAVVLRSCGIPEAAWLEGRELVICYELLDLYYVLSADQHGGAVRAR